MEYRVVGGTYADCTGVEITGLAKGQYEVRYKESKNYTPSVPVTITIAENEVITYPSEFFCDTEENRIDYQTDGKCAAYASAYVLAGFALFLVGMENGNDYSR